MSTAKRKLLRVKLAQINPMPIPASMEAAFIALERPAPKYSDVPEPAANRSTLAQDGR